MEPWLQVITQLGFPIAMCGAMAWFIYKMVMPLIDLMKKLDTKLDVIIQYALRKEKEDDDC